MTNSAPNITVRNGATGKVAIINGKTYTLLRSYERPALGGVFFVVVVGRVPLKPDDLAEHWRVIRSGDVYIAMNARAFSYHLIEGDNTPTDAPKWPRLKTTGDFFTFVGPTAEAARTQIKLTMERYHAKLTPDEAVEQAKEVPDLCGGPPAYLLRADCL